MAGKRPTIHRLAGLSDPERRRLFRRLRLEWACAGDLEQAAGVERMIASRAGFRHRSVPDDGTEAA